MYKWSLGQVPRYMYKGETLVDMLILMFAVDFCNKWGVHPFVMLLIHRHVAEQTALNTIFGILIEL